MGCMPCAIRSFRSAALRTAIRPRAYCDSNESWCGLCGMTYDTDWATASGGQRGGLGKARIVWGGFVREAACVRCAAAVSLSVPFQPAGNGTRGVEP